MTRDLRDAATSPCQRCTGISSRSQSRVIRSYWSLIKAFSGLTNSA